MQKGNLLPNISKIDVKKIKFEISQKKKHERLENIKELVDGIDPI